jgi:hypothetical protein
MLVACLLLAIGGLSPDGEVISKSARPQAKVVANLPAPPTSPAALPVARATAVPSRASVPPLPYTFLGRFPEGETTVVVLYANGRTWTVRGPGPLDDRYEVEAVHEDHMVLRHVPLDKLQLLALSAREVVALTGSPEDYPQD